MRRGQCLPIWSAPDAEQHIDIGASARYILLTDDGGSMSDNDIKKTVQVNLRVQDGHVEIVKEVVSRLKKDGRFFDELNFIMGSPIGDQRSRLDALVSKVDSQEGIIKHMAGFLWIVAVAFNELRDINEVNDPHDAIESIGDIFGNKPYEYMNEFVDKFHSYKKW